MLAMHYAIDLEAGDVDAVRRRVIEIGPAFDRLPGLVAKAFLVSVSPPRYALYYLWADVGAMERFLDGPRFAAVVNKYGRPDVTLYVTAADRMPFRAGDRVAVSAHAVTGKGPVIELTDPRRGERTVLGCDPSGPFECLYLASSTA